MKLRWQLGASRVLLRDSADLTRQWNCVSPFICYFSDTFTIADMTASTAVTADMIMLCSIICVYDIISLILKCTYHMVVGRQYIDWYPD